MIGTFFFRTSYKYFLKPLFFRRDPEQIHDNMIRMGKNLGKYKITRVFTKKLFAYSHPMLKQTICGITFTNPIGLTAGFDKNAEIIPITASVGFGFTEIGSITGEPCEGNPKPRLWRLPKSHALMVWYGLKNDGCEVIEKRLKEKTWEIPVGTSVARTNNSTTVEMKAGITDYVKAFTAMSTIGAYTTVNISCPNTCGGEPFTTTERLEKLLHALDAVPTQKPIFLKLPIDLPLEEIDALLQAATRHRIHGIIIANLTKKREAKTIYQQELTDTMKGGISGAPTKDLGIALIRYAYTKYGGRFAFIASGGIFTAEDAYEKIKAGASLLQLATGMIFQGPQLIGEINKKLVELLKKDGFSSIAEARGKE